MTDITSTRQLIAKQIQKNQLGLSDLDSYEWWLLGTNGCHLCEDVEKMLRLFSSVTPISLIKIDIAYLDEALMMQFASSIPLIITPFVQLNYPFSLLDLQDLANK